MSGRRAAVACAAWWALDLPGYAAFRAALADPQPVQDRLLRGYVSRNADTAFGRRHRFATIDSPADFRRRVPIADYDALAPDIERIADGGAGVLTAERVVRFATSSGSTRARKLIPQTRGLQREFSRAIGPWIVDLFTREPSLAGGCAYWSISPVADVDDVRLSPRPPTAPPIGFANDGDYLGGPLSRLVDGVMAVPAMVRHVRDVATFRYVTARLLLGRTDLRLISVWHPTFLGLLLDTVNDHWRLLIEDVARGTVSPPGGASDVAAKALAHDLRPDATRADALRHIDPHRVSEIWPRLGLVSCWADAHAAPAAAVLATRLDGIAVQPKGLLATEAFVTIPFAGRWPLAVRSHHFEFVDDAGRVHACDALRDGGEYAILVTTAGGLWRYRLGDRVRVDGHLGRTPSLRFVGREDHVVDRFGEKLSEGFVGGVVRGVLAEAGIGPCFALLAPEVIGGRTRYTLFIAGYAPHVELAARLDERLRENPHYAYCRRLGQLDAPRVTRVAADADERYLAAIVASGRRLGDVKPAALSDRTDWRSTLRCIDDRPA